ncbi:MAG: phytanoyl-CoA dioxygenase family protein [Phycisphaeraceae bacterium]|nr:phytanoyl-CoA dioxygenase family protein [Phycisphaeraceae bacterium]
MNTAASASETSALPLQSPSVLSDRERYFFDLRGYLVLKNALSSEHLLAINHTLDQYLDMDPPLAHGDWNGCVQAHTFGGDDGMNLQQIYEAGEPFEQLIDHGAWYEKIRTLIGIENTFDAHHGPMFIDENFVSLRGPGKAIGMHSGGADHTMRTHFGFDNGRFHCGQINALMAFKDIGPGDGATMVIPGSHKSNLIHPDWEQHRMKEGENTSGDGFEGAIEVHMHAGDVLLFTDAICHGAARRVNEGLRRIGVYRYGPSWGFFRHGYRPSAALLKRLSPQQRQIVWPHQAIPRTPNRQPNTPAPQELIK